MLRGMVAAALAAATISCGGGSSDTMPSPLPNGPTITITASGVSPRTITISRGTQVTFVNNDSRSHDMTSDPHPEHTDCPEINQVGLLRSGQSRQTGNLNTARTCGFHDHDNPFNATLRGSITIQ